MLAKPTDVDGADSPSKKGGKGKGKAAPSSGPAVFSAIETIEMDEAEAQEEQGLAGAFDVEGEVSAMEAAAANVAETVE